MGYFERALIAAALIGAVAGLVGVSVVLRKRTFFAQALTHATYPGAVLAAAVGVSVPLGAALAGVVIVLIMLLIARGGRQSMQAAAGIVLTGGFASGAILQSLLPNLTIRPETFLTGSILTVSWGDLTLAATVGIAAVLVHLFLGRRLMFSTVDGTGFRAAGYREWPIELTVLALTVATVVAALPAVGAVLAIALIAGPPIVARALCNSYRQILFVSPFIGAAAALAGVYLSRILDIPAGPAIVLVASGFAALALSIQQFKKLVPRRVSFTGTRTENLMLPRSEDRTGPHTANPIESRTANRRWINDG